MNIQQLIQRKREEAVADFITGLLETTSLITQLRLVARRDTEEVSYLNLMSTEKLNSLPSNITSSTRLTLGAWERAVAETIVRLEKDCPWYAREYSKRYTLKEKHIEDI